MSGLRYKEMCLNKLWNSHRSALNTLVIPLPVLPLSLTVIGWCHDITDISDSLSGVLLKCLAASLEPLQMTFDKIDMWGLLNRWIVRFSCCTLLLEAYLLQVTHTHTYLIRILVFQVLQLWHTKLLEQIQYQYKCCQFLFLRVGLIRIFWIFFQFTCGTLQCTIIMIMMVHI
jgi:hypothetical protein